MAINWKRKSVKLRGKRKRMRVCCPHCGKLKTIEYRRSRKGQWITGAVEVNRDQ